MKIYSFNSDDWSKDTSDRVLKLIAAAKGPVVLPIEHDVLAWCREEAKKPRLVEELKRTKMGLAPFYVAILALAEGKVVFPFFNREDKKIQKKIGRRYFIRETLSEHTDDLVRLEAIRRRFEAGVDAERMLSLYKRFQLTRPELVFAEDNFAIVLGKLFRVRVHPLTRHSRVGIRIARRVYHAALKKSPQSKPPSRRRRMP